jgi:hypothetical protein
MPEMSDWTRTLLSADMQKTPHRRAQARTKAQVAVVGLALFIESANKVLQPRDESHP